MSASVSSDNFCFAIAHFSPEIFIKLMADFVRMRVGVLFSGGKDSTLALNRAARLNEPVCLITIVSKDPASYMFHTPNIELTKLQSEALGLPLVRAVTKGKKEAELADLASAIREAKEKYKIQGVVTGAVRSTYQASRIQKICADLELWCFNPLWLVDQVALLEEIVESRMDVIIGAVLAEGMGPILGRRLDNALIADLVKLQKKHGINPAGEGGEFESAVLDAPMFKKKIHIVKSKKELSGDSGMLRILDAKLVAK